ncbi:MAG: hypothetical protein KDC92_12025 [Bacteroidetes bacterium]|nr:hypothetical protein [Bacteroidota bacterium]
MNNFLFTSIVVLLALAGYNYYNTYVNIMANYTQGLILVILTSIALASFFIKSKKVKPLINS